MKKFNNEIAGLTKLSEISDPLSSQEMENLKRNILQAIAGTKPEEMAAPRRFKILSLINFIIAALLGLSLLGGTAFAAGGSIPGDVLYPVKLATEKVELNLVFSEQAKIKLQASFAQERLSELRKLLAKNPDVAIAPKPANGSNFSSSSPAGIILTGNGTSTASSSNYGIVATGGVNPEQDRIIKLTNQARANAAAEVNSALGALQREQAQLQNNGNTGGAAEIAKNISDLQSQAQAQNINIGGINNTKDNGKTIDEHKASGEGTGKIQNQNGIIGVHQNSYQKDKYFPKKIIIPSLNPIPDATSTINFLNTSTSTASTTIGSEQISPNWTFATSTGQTPPAAWVFPNFGTTTPIQESTGTPTGWPNQIRRHDQSGQNSQFGTSTSFGNFFQN